MKIRAIVPLLLAAAASAAELPYGLVEVDKTGVLVRFDAAARPGLGLGQMVALYGPGSVVKHPLTGKIVTEQRKLLAKGQIVAIEGERLRLNVLWRAADAQPESGWDAVPLPGEAAPNAPPAATTALTPQVAAAGATVTIKLPVLDPDGDAMVFSWELVGATGRCGRLDARLTTQPTVAWTAPAVAPEGGIALKATVSDPLGQQVVLNLPLEVKGNDDPRRPRRIFAGLGTGQEPAWTRLERSDDGSWIGVDDSNRVLRAGADWQLAVPLALGDARKPLVAIARGKDIYVLDRDKPAVLVFSEAGQLRRSLVGLSDPSDLAVASDGTTFVADQRAGGVMVFDGGGRFRVRVGRVGEDLFAEVTRVCTTADGGLIVLDAQARRLHRYDSELRRLDAWTITGDPKTRPIDVAAHPRGLLVALDDGSVQLFGAKGTVAETWKAGVGAGLVDELGTVMSIAADSAGEVLVCHSGGVTVRLAADGRVLGLRGPGILGNATRWAADGLGRILALDVDYGLLSVHDGEGWRTARIGGRVRSGGPFAEAGAMAVVPDGSAIAVLDVDKYSVVRFDGRDLRKAPLIFGASGSNPGQFKSPVSIAADEAGRIYVLDDSLYRVSVFDAAGQFLFSFGERGTAPNQLDEPLLVAVSPTGDAGYIFDTDRYEVKKYALDQQAKSGRHLATGGGKGSDPGQFRKPTSMLVDRQGLLHILDTSRGDWQVLDFRGQSLLPLAARPTAELLRGTSALALSPDGTAWLVGGGAAVGLR